MKVREINNYLLSAMFFLLALGNSPLASAVAISDGNYLMLINVTPEVAPGSGIPDVGSDGAWNSSFTLGDLPSSVSSQRMTDNGVTVAGRGGIDGDGVAGRIGITVSGGTISFTSFSVDTIQGTAAGNFAQYADDTSGMNGTTTDTVTSFDLVGRLAAVDGTPGFIGFDWNVAIFTTGASSNPLGTIWGLLMARQ